MKRSLALAAFALATTLPPVLAQSLLPAADTFVATSSPNNFGTSPLLNVGGAAGYQGLIQFDLSSLPSGITGASVAKASLTLFVNKIGAAGAVSISAASGAWAESTVNGSNAPLAGMVVAGSVPVSSGGTYTTVDATALVKAWLDGVISNQGVLITADPAFAGTSVFFDSKESAGTSHPAMLQVSLAGAGTIGTTGAAGPTGATGPQGATGLTGSPGPAGLNGASGPVGPTGPAGAPGSLGPAPQFKRVTFLALNVPKVGQPPVTLATLTFTPQVAGTAVIRGRGTCDVPSTTYDSMIFLAAGTDSATVFSGLAGDTPDWAVVQVQSNSDASYSTPTWTTEKVMPVLAQTPYTISLFAEHYLGNRTDHCTGSMAVEIF